MATNVAGYGVHDWIIYILVIFLDEIKPPFFQRRDHYILGKQILQQEGRPSSFSSEINMLIWPGKQLIEKGNRKRL